MAVLMVAGIGVAAFILLRGFVSGGWCNSKARMDGKTVIITGANTGIGKEAAKDLAKRGAKVILACRDLTKAKAAADDIRKFSGSDKVVVRKLDLNSLASVRQFAEETIAEEDRLDVLLNNAGIMCCPQMETEDGFEMQIGTNHFGHFLLTNLLLDLLKKSSPSRIVNVSSGAYKMAKQTQGDIGIRFEDINQREVQYNTRFAYGQSKLANILFSLELTKRLKGTGVTANSLHPGIIDTDLVRHMVKLIPMSFILVPILTAIMKMFIKTPVQGAQTSIYCCVEESLKTTSGVYFSDCAPKKLLEFAKDEEAARKLWELSAEAVGLEKKLE